MCRCCLPRTSAQTEDGMKNAIGIAGAQTVIFALALGGFSLAVGQAGTPFSISSVFGQEKKQTFGKVDLYGDLLPEGAIARLGTVRFGHATFPEAVAFAPSGNIVALGGGPSSRVVSLVDA